MNDIQKNILRRRQDALFGAFLPHLSKLAIFLYGKGVITLEECTRVIQTNANASEGSELFFKLPEKCSMDTFLEAVDKFIPAYSGCLQSEIKQETLCLTKTPGKVDNMIEKRKGTIEIFRDQLLRKVLNAEALGHFELLHNWKSKLIDYIKQPDVHVPLRLKRSIADCCFVVTDALTVIERTHNADKTSLWKSDLFPFMKDLIPETSNPSLATVRYHGRYGAALALGNKVEEGRDYIEVAIQDALSLSSARDLGNCIFALVNIKLQNYNGDQEVKKEILEEVERGINMFVEECEVLQRTWRQVYLIKKIFCHLGIDLFMNDVPVSEISPEDKICANECLREFEQYMDKDNVDKRRKMQYYRARSKIHNMKEPKIALGFLEEAIDIGKVGGFQKEVTNMKHLLQFGFNRNASDWAVISSSSREPVENSETEDNETCTSEVTNNNDESPDSSPMIENNDSQDKTKLSLEVISEHDRLFNSNQTIWEDHSKGRSNDENTSCEQLKQEHIDYNIVDNFTKDIAQQLHFIEQ